MTLIGQLSNQCPEMEDGNGNTSYKSTVQLRLCDM